MSHGLDAELLENPDDESLRLVLADKLLAAGDPRGELIVVQSKRANDPADAALIARERELIAVFERDVPNGVVVTWQLGFARAAWIPGDHFAVAGFLASDNARYLRELAVEIEDNEPADGIRFTRLVLGAIAEAKRPTVETLAIKRRHFDDYDLFATGERAFDCRALWPALPALENLELDGVDIVASIDHPRLATLRLDDRPIHPAARWNLPALSWIDWYCYWESSGVPVDSHAETFDPLWRQDLPALRELSLAASIADPIADERFDAAMSFIGKLWRLRVPVSLFGDVDAVRANAHHLHHLDKLLLLDAEPADGDLHDVLPRVEYNSGRPARRGRRYASTARRSV